MKWTVKSRPWITGARKGGKWRVLTWGWVAYDPKGKLLDDETNFYRRWEDAYARAQRDVKSWVGVPGIADGVTES